jgi:hypothetical protein
LDGDDFGGVIGSVDRALLYVVTLLVLAGCFGGGRDSESGGTMRERECTNGFFCASDAEHAKSAAEAERLFKRSCDLDYPRGCLSLAYAYREGKVMIDYHDVAFAKDPERAFVAYDKACSLKEGAGCLLAAEMITKGDITTRGPAAPWLEKACDLEATSRQNDNCAPAAEARAAAGDEDRALALYKQGCDHGMGSPSCLGLARMEIKRGHGAAAEKPLGDACFFGKSATACAESGKLAAQKGDAAEAARQFRSACELGDQESCTLAADARKARESELRRADAERDRQWEADRKKADAAAATSAPRGGGGGASSPSGGGAQTIHLADASANGIHAKTVDCTLQTGNVMSSFILLAGLADRTTALRACGIKKAFVAEWAMSGGTITSATAHGTGAPATDACAARALRQMKQSFTGTCTAELEVQ